jgi:hypothetical protein
MVIRRSNRGSPQRHPNPHRERCTRVESASGASFDDGAASFFAMDAID